MDKRESTSFPVGKVWPDSKRLLSLNLLSELSLILAGSLLLPALVLAGVQDLPGPLALLRLLLGLVLALITPGYALQAALFPRASDLDSFERAALSFVLSLALIPTLALALDRLPWGVRLWPVVVSISLTNLVFSLIAAVQRSRIPVQERFSPSLPHWRDWWAVQPRSARVLCAVSALALAMALFAAATILLLPAPADYFTEFYLLGPEGLAESYPREGTDGQPLAVTVGVTNRERAAASYRVEVQNDGQVIGQAGPFALEPGETFESPVQFTPHQAGKDVQIVFLLYRQDIPRPEPYRSLRLWLSVKP